MKIRVVLLSALLGATALSCASPSDREKQAKQQAPLPEGLAGGVPENPTVVVSPNFNGLPTPPAPASPAPGPATVAPATPVKAPAATPPPPPELPKSAQWTIYCSVVHGPDHVARAQQLKSQLVRMTAGHPDWYVMHADEASTIYYGFYGGIERGTKDGDRAQADLAWVRGLKTADGSQPLQLACVLRLDKGDPEANPQWNLANIGRGANGEEHYWSLQIGAYTSDGVANDGDASHDRKWAAVESVKDLRKQGVEAYYFHGPAVSSVCVGMWARGAVKEQKDDNGFGGEAINPDMSILVANTPLPHGMRAMNGPDGRPLRTYSPRVEILDPRMYATVKKYPYHETNGVLLGQVVKDKMGRPVQDPSTNKAKVVPDSSFLVLVPETKQSTNGPAGPTIAGDDALMPLTSPLMDPPARRIPSPGGRLRSIDDR